MENITINQLIFKVLLNPYVIGTTIAVILMLNFCCYVASYKKKPPKPKGKKVIAAPAPAPAPAPEKEGGFDAGGGDAAPAPEA